VCGSVLILFKGQQERHPTSTKCCYNDYSQKFTFAGPEQCVCNNSSSSSVRNCCCCCYCHQKSNTKPIWWGNGTL